MVIDALCAAQPHGCAGENRYPVPQEKSTDAPCLLFPDESVGVLVCSQQSMTGVVRSADHPVLITQCLSCQCTGCYTSHIQSSCRATTESQGLCDTTEYS